MRPFFKYITVLGILALFTPTGMAAPKTVKFTPQNRLTPAVKAIEKAAPSIVGISTRLPISAKSNPFQQSLPTYPNLLIKTATTEDFEKPIGSGIVVDEDYVLTHEGILSQGASFRITMDQDHHYEAMLIGTDHQLRLAVLKVQNAAGVNLPKIHTPATKDLLVGETVLAVGNPYGTGAIAFSGILTRDFQNRAPLNAFLQTDATINAENAGGALVNLNGEVMGINTNFAGTQPGANYAIPIEKAIESYENILSSLEVASQWIGITVRKSDQASGGFAVVNVDPDGPAKTAGILPGDILFGADEHGFESRQDLAQNLMSQDEEQGALKLDFARDSKPLQVEINKTEFPSNKAVNLGRSLLGVDALDITAETSRRYNLKANQGVVIRRVIEKSPAALLGLQIGDVIHQVGGQEVITLDEFKRAIIQARPLPTILLLVQRGGTTSFVSVATDPNSPLDL